MRPVKQTREGWWVLGDDTHLSKWVEECGRLDHDGAIGRIVEHIPEGGVVVDAGASLGDHTIAYARKVGVNGKVFAFEPHPQAFACLAMNMRIFPQVVCLPVGLSTEPSLIEFDGTNDCAGMSKFTPGGSYSRPVVSLDSLEAWFERLDFIKLDIEGFEPEALLGAERLIESYRPVIFCEVNREALNSPAETLMDQIRDLGYRVQRFDDQRSPDDFNGVMFDVLCLPQ